MIKNLEEYIELFIPFVMVIGGSLVGVWQANEDGKKKIPPEKMMMTGGILLFFVHIISGLTALLLARAGTSNPFLLGGLGGVFGMLGIAGIAWIVGVAKAYIRAKLKLDDEPKKK